MPLDSRLPESLLPEVASVNRRRGRVDIFTGYARRAYTLRELIVAADCTDLALRENLGLELPARGVRTVRC